MNRAELKEYISETFGADGDCPWIDSPDSEVFRHGNNRKWFALVMRIPWEKLEKDRAGMVDVVNLKCDPELIGAMRREPGIYPAYHMNKKYWLTAALDGSASDETVKALTELSYDLTAVKAGKDRKKIKKRA